MGHLNEVIIANVNTILLEKATFVCRITITFCFPTIFSHTMKESVDEFPPLIMGDT